MSESKELIAAVARVIDLRGDVSRIGPTWIATEAMNALDPERKAPHVVYTGCHLQLRQIARSLLRGRFDDSEVGTERDDLFPDLQRRYPAARSASAEEPEYVLLNDLTDEDVGYNVARLRAEADAKQRHADALEAWGRSRPLASAA